MKTRHAILPTAACLALSAAHADVTVYDAASAIVTIPSVSVGTTTYTHVRLRQQGDGTFALESADALTHGAPGVARYDAASGRLDIPAVRVGADTYVDVALQGDAQFAFALLQATPLPPAVASEVSAFISAAVDDLFASAAPASGASRYAYLDACYLDEGRTRAWLIADYDASLAGQPAEQAYLVGRRHANLQVLALRQSTNTDGSSRREVDVQYDVRFADGSVATGVTATLVSGSSAGSCATPQTGSDWRALGNRRLVGIDVRARNIRTERYAIADGSALSPRVQYRRDIEWRITDPLGNASYVVVSGPGPAGSVEGRSEPFSLKMVSPRVMRDAPEFLGKRSNYLNWLDDDGFRWCDIATSGIPVAALADCAGRGARASDIGWTANTPDAAADAGFAGQGWRAGAVYRIDVYADDGWKTVGGHVGKTPVATYYEMLEALPYTFVEMAGAGVDADGFARLSFGGLTPVQVRANAVSASPATMAVSWNAPAAAPDGAAFALFQGWEFHQGPAAGNTGNAFNPAYRAIHFVFPGAAATAERRWPVTVPVAGQSGKTYTEFALLHTDRKGRQVRSIVAFQ